MKKRLIALLLCVALVLSIVPSAFAAVNTSKVFKDVKKGDWFYKNGAIDYVYNNNLFSGTSKTTFGPNDKMTRAMFVTVLGRLEAVTVDKTKRTRFVDVPTKQYYTGYVKWAADNGIVSGVSDADFGPDANITREQICAMLIRYCDYAKVELEAVNATLTFTDNSQISSYARSAVKACQKAGLVNGEKVTGGYRFRPKGNATRAEVATILMNFAKKYADVHSWIAGTPNENGCITTTTYFCEDCFAEKTVIDTTHSYSVTSARKPDCLNTGRTAGVVCYFCDTVFAVSKTLPKSDHAWKAATCDTPKTCKVCYKTSGGPAGHDMNNGKCSRYSTCGAMMTVYEAAGQAVATLFEYIDPSTTMYINTVRYVKGCKESTGSNMCENGAYTFYIIYKIGNTVYADYVGVHLYATHATFWAHEGMERASSGTELDVDRVVAEANKHI